MLLGIELVIAVAAIAGGVAMFVVALRRRPAPHAIPNSDTTTIGIFKANVYSLTIIALAFFGTTLLIDVLT